ncbi:MAG: type I-C CRISPR-associated protein Cas7/Csd2 [Kiritimatiellae bacterium]|nr:type I-C CRISPR-associated protein Cas7/Csd2 [Kiritimatiellia bacterium]
MATPLKNRYDFMLVFDVKDGNPNGDPDAGNLPRVDSETGEGLITDVCLKRKVRNYVQLIKGTEVGYDIFVKEKAVLNNLVDEAYAELGIDANAKKPAKGEAVDKGRALMCKKFFDIRTFGAVLSSGANAGQVRGPVQMTFARSVDPVVTFEHSITRMAVTKAEDVDKERTMGRKNTIPYGLYVSYGFVSPSLAAQTGFSEADLETLWTALVNMFDQDHSAARGMMATQKLIVFKHDFALGNAPSHKLFDLVKIAKKNGVTVPRKFADYDVTVPSKDALPSGIEIIEK